MKLTLAWRSECVALALFFASVDCGKKSVICSSKSTRKPLILTPYIDEGNLVAGRKAAAVKPFLPGIRSYSGFFTVKKKHNSNMFFWYFPPIENGKTMDLKDGDLSPVILWLQGGPGSSSMFAALRELGPLHLNENGTLSFNEYSWADRAHLFFIDNPVGSGFSFSDIAGYSTNLDQVSENLYSAVIQFLTLFDLKENKFFITGESYAGKYIPSLGARIHYGNAKPGSFQINLQGVAIGDGLVDPANMMDFGNYLYQLGLIDLPTKKLFNHIRDTIKYHLERKELAEALRLYHSWIQREVGSKTPTLFNNVTGLNNYFNYLLVDTTVSEKKLLNRFFRNKKVAHALHADGVKFYKSNKIAHKLMEFDLLLSEVEDLKLLMNNYRVLLYHGQLDIKDSYPLMLNYLRKIKWKGANEYRHATRQLWLVDGQLAGYYKTAGDFTEALVRDASHMVPSDQPKWAQRMILNFVAGRPLGSSKNETE